MTITQLDIHSRADNNSKIDTLEPQNTPNTGLVGAGFGQVMSQLRQAQHESATPKATKDTSATRDAHLTGGQEMAAGVPDVSLLFNFHNPELGSWSLKAVNLGPTLNVITPDQAAPDAQSLEAFARSQGLDENAVQWLMGKPLDTLIPMTMQPSTELLVPSTNTAAENSLQSAALNLSATGPVVTASASAAPQAPLSPALGEAPDPTGALGTVTQALTSGAALWALALNEDSQASATTAHNPNDLENAETAAIQLQLMRQPAPAATWLLRQTLNPDVKTDRAIAMSILSESELDLSADISAEWVDSLMAGQDNPQGTAAPANNTHPAGLSSSRPEGAVSLSSSLPPTAEAEQTGTTAAERSENIQNLAEKMGQAVGKRMLTEIEKGQWHLKLQLRPATLGHIEVEMRMLSGELDAVFNAPQALTRELLQEGMSRLKETLSQMGMDVASMQVKDGQTRQNGGKSTPNQASKSTDLVNNDSKSTNSTIIQVARHKMGEDGWDVLV